MFEPEELMARIVDLEEQLKVSEMAPPAAEQLIACLEGEIAKRDARIMGLESQYQRDVYGLNNEGDPIGGEPAGGYANDNARLRAELAALKAQDTVGEVVGWYRLDRPYEMTPYPSVCATWHRLGAPVARLNAAPVQQVSVPVSGVPSIKCWSCKQTVSLDDRADADGNCPHCRVELDLEEYLRAMLAAAPAAPAADAGLVEARKANNELVNDLHVMTNKRRQLVDALTYLRECLDPEDYMGEISMHDFIDDALAAHRSTGVV